ncbi:alpha-L-rhamnosidase [Streptomyces sp. KM273126]|uniref:alpha-L-rhamnosidase-related protein n=1 Tax=Streptomyces sp. KM273126 TaxID=2545247 RepID=UPI00140537B4|nr:alpha-L-rhamnosidase [Streptomyces sp. KM273126]MBA2810564.1 alpha-L-rhamnosidase [Streptomyces sp. KM273126]
MAVDDGPGPVSARHHDGTVWSIPAKGRVPDGTRAQPPERGEWPGGWIGPAGRESDGRFGRVLFRRTFDLTGTPPDAVVRITGDSRYVLFVNGTEMARGPQRSQPHRIHYDEWDIAEQLTEGRNTLAVLVTYFGESNAIWQRPVASGRLGAAPALLVAGTIGGVPVDSGPAWRAVRCDAWTPFSQQGVEGVPATCCDARRLPADWTRTDFPDAAWPPAAPLTAAHRGAAGRWVPPVAPYFRPLPRSIPPLGGETVRPVTVSAFTVPRAVTGEPDDTTHPAVSAASAQTATGGERWRKSVSPDADGTVATHVDAGEDLVVAVDFGRVVVGAFAFTLDVPEGTFVDVAFHERFADTTDALTPRSGFRYIARGSADTYRSPDTGGMRSATIRVRPVRPGPVSIAGTHLAERLQPIAGDASFSSDDPELDALWQAGVRTVHANSSDAFTDCPSREQRAWVGDGVVHQAVHLVANHDWRAARAYVDLARSPRPDGLLPMSVAGDLEQAGGSTIPSWSLHWIHGLHTLFRYAGLVPEVRRGLATARGVLEWFTDYVDHRGTLDDVPHWNLIDWSSVITEGRCAAITALWCRALREYAEVCTHVGDTDSARWANDLYANAANGFADFWDAGRGLYVDCVADGRPLSPTSQATNAAAIVSGVAPKARWNGIIDRISDPERLVVRSWLGAVGGGLDTAKWNRVSAGPWEIDWDTHTRIVRAEPFFSYVVHDAYALAERTDVLLASVRDWTGFLHDGFDTFGEAWGWGTPCHGWSATPTKDLTRYVLGVTPDVPAFTVARVAPRPRGLGRITGRTPTPHGVLTLTVEDGLVEVTSPVPVAFVPLHGERRLLPAGSHHLELEDAAVARPGQRRDRNGGGG